MFYPARILATGLLSAAALAFALLPPGRGVTQATGPVLYGVTGEGGANPKALFRIDHETGSSNLLTSLGNGGDGEEIAYNPQSGWLLHASGRVIGADLVLEWVHPLTLNVTPIEARGDDCDEVSALTYAGSGTFLAGTIDQLLCSISSDGLIQRVTTLETDDITTGLAWLDGKLSMTEWGNQTDLLTIDPESGAITSVIELKVDTADYRFTALAANPCNGRLYAAMAIGSTEIRKPASRSLVIIDPASGVVSVVKDLGGSFAGLAFAGSACSEPPRPNVGGAISSLQAAQASQRAALASEAAAPAGQTSLAATETPTVVIRPPNTGDGGMLVE